MYGPNFRRRYQHPIFRNRKCVKSVNGASNSNPTLTHFCWLSRNDLRAFASKASTILTNTSKYKWFYKLTMGKFDALDAHLPQNVAIATIPVRQT